VLSRSGNLKTVMNAMGHGDVCGQKSTFHVDEKS